jgi:hypothetical protein
MIGRRLDTDFSFLLGNSENSGAMVYFRDRGNYSGARPERHRRKYFTEFFEMILPLRDRGGEKSARATESFGSAKTPETSGNILFDFGHAQVALGLVVGKGHARRSQEG